MLQINSLVYESSGSVPLPSICMAECCPYETFLIRNVY